MPESSQLNSSPTGAHVIPLADFAEASALFSTWNGRLEQITRGRFTGVLRTLSGRLVRLVDINANQRILIHGHDVEPVFTAFLVTERNAQSLWHRRQLTPGQLVFSSIDGDTDHLSGRYSENRGVFLRPDLLEEAARALMGGEVPPLTRSWGTLAPPPDPFHRLNDLLGRLLHSGLADPSFLGTPEGYRLEQECVRALVGCLYSTAVPRVDLPLPSRSVVLHRAEELMRANLDAPIGAIDLCRELGVSDRTLRLAFHERYGMGPMAYFKCLRLNAVRSGLRSVPLTAVTEIAGAFGFHHMGNFAADYRRLFGERPSETLRRFAEKPLLRLDYGPPIH